MMRLARRASRLVAFCLLTSAATAHAECAWVLWGHVVAGDQWRLYQAFEKLAACEAYARNLEDGWSKLPEPKAAMDTRCLPRHHGPARAEGEMNRAH